MFYGLGCVNTLVRQQSLAQHSWERVLLQARQGIRYKKHRTFYACHRHD